MGSASIADYVALKPSAALWERVFTVAPLVLIGTLDPDGRVDLAPKHMVTPNGATANSSWSSASSMSSGSPSSTSIRNW